MKPYAAPLTCLFGLLFALTAAAKPPLAAGEWPDTLPHALAGCGVAVLGLWFWRRQPHPLWAESSPAEEEEQLLAAGGRLEPCLAALQALQTRLPTLTVTAMAAELEIFYTRHLLPLSQTHKQFMAGVAQEQGLERLALFSQAELWINRARSAAGDQHQAESLQSLEKATASLLELQRLLNGTPP
ncbi:MAG: hypothetical protein HQL90_09980 [Magnetococcales bacterium]|nr:hypothetical protein [Magnetococcales bacterium]